MPCFRLPSGVGRINCLIDLQVVLFLPAICTAHHQIDNSRLLGRDPCSGTSMFMGAWELPAAFGQVRYQVHDLPPYPSPPPSICRDC